MTLLKIENLAVSFTKEKHELHAVRQLSLSMEKGQILGIVGESGSGKSVSAKSIMGLLPPSASIKKGSIQFKGQELLGTDSKVQVRLRGKEIAMIFQDPMTSLNPVYTIGTQISDVIRKHQGLSKKNSLKAAIEALRSVGISSPEKRIKNYPHEFSGGMLQRVMIAMALSCKPSLLIADEPTTALDVTIQAQILALMASLKKSHESSILLITHDLGVVAELCDRVVVMYGGHVLEEGPVRDIFYQTGHPYTKGLIGSIPSVSSDQALVPIKGSPPHPSSIFKGCPFASRCQVKIDRCDREQPPYIYHTPSHMSMCWLNYKGVK